MYQVWGTDCNLFHCLWNCPLIQIFWQRILFANTSYNLGLTPAWALFGQLPIGKARIPPFQKKLLFCISAATHKTILQTWLDPEFLEKLTFLLRMDWVNTFLYKDTKVQAFFDTWSTIIQIKPESMNAFATPVDTWRDLLQGTF